MTFQEFLQNIGLTEISFWGILVFLMSIGIEVIPKVKWRPWSSLISWLGSKLNTHIDNKLEEVRTDIKKVQGEIKAVELKVDNVQDKLSKHITESSMKDLADTRRDILDFANACMNGRKHTQEQYKFILKKCDKYRAYVKENNIENGEINGAMDEIMRLYKERRQKNDFLKEGEDPEEHVRRSIIEEVIKEVHRLYDTCPGRSKSLTVTTTRTRTSKTRKKDSDEEGVAEA